MPLSKPDVTKFDSDDDSIRDARPEIETAFTSLNTIIDDYNTNGETFGRSLLYPTLFTEIDTSGGSQSVALDNGYTHVVRVKGGNTATIGIENFDLETVHYITVFSEEVGTSTLTTINAKNYSGQFFNASLDSTDGHYDLRIAKYAITSDSAGTQFNLNVEQSTGSIFYDL